MVDAAQGRRELIPTQDGCEILKYLASGKLLQERMDLALGTRNADGVNSKNRTDSGRFAFNVNEPETGMKPLCHCATLITDAGLEFSLKAFMVYKLCHGEQTAQCCWVY